MLRKIICYLKQCYQWRQSKRDCLFYIFDGDTHLATLKNPCFCEMYWSYYELCPQTSDKALLTRLYSNDFWLSEQINFIGEQTKFSYEFFVAGFDKGYWTDEKQQEVCLEDRPKKVLLRGPYLKL